MAVGLIGILVYFYSSALASGSEIYRYRQLCITSRDQGLLQANLPAQCSMLGTSVLIATLGPDAGIVVALVGFYVSLMAEVNLLVERKINRIRKV